jgi:hypothetical protein
MRWFRLLFILRTYSLSSKISLGQWSGQVMAQLWYDPKTSPKATEDHGPDSAMFDKRNPFTVGVLWNHRSPNLNIVDCKQILAQQPFLVRAFPFGISRQICFFYEVGLSDQCPQPLLHEEKALTYPGFEPGTLGFQVGNATNWTIEVVWIVVIRNALNWLYSEIC